jgi:predicted ATP-grasp superfamily ATP-dependent carboligase
MIGPHGVISTIRPSGRGPILAGLERSGDDSPKSRPQMRDRAQSRETYDRGAPVLILKMKDAAFHHGALGIIRSFGRLGVPVYCSTETGAAPAARSRYLTRPAFPVLDAGDRTQRLEALKAFQDAVGRPMVVIPVDDKGALFLAENAEALRPRFLLPPQKADLPRETASKADHGRLFGKTDVQTPATWVIRRLEDLDAAGPAYPVVVKIAQPWLLPPRALPAFLARTREDVAAYFLAVKAKDADIIVQEYIPDPFAEDWFYHACCDQDGAPLVAFTGRKFRSYPAFFGATSYGVSLVNPEVLAIGGTLLRALGYAGIVELEFRFDRRDGRYLLIDFNPRPGAQFQFLRNEGGVDVVRALHLNLTGRPVPAGRQVEHVAFVSDFTDFAALHAYRCTGHVRARQWLRQYLGAQERAWLAWDDPGPFVAACGLQWKAYAAARRAGAVTLPWKRHAPDGRAP